MLNSGNNVNRSSATPSSTMPSLPQCLPLEPIMLSNQKYTRTGELSRVLGLPLGSITDDHSLGVGHSKPPPPVATEELKHFKESVQDASRRARDRAKMLRESIFKLDKYKEALSSKKRQRSDLSSSERSNGVNIVKLGSQIYKNPRENMTQRLEDRTKSVGFNKRVRTSVADVRADVRSAATSRQQVVTDKDEKMPQAVNAASVRIEEKSRRLLARGEGLDQKVKKKRSVGAVSHRITGGERDIQRATHPKLSGDLKLRSCDVQGVRLKTSLGVGGINKSEPSFELSNLSTCTVLKNDLENAPVPKDRSVLLEQRVVKGDIKLNIQEENPVGSLNTVIKGKVSRAPRTGSIMNLDSSPNVHSPSAPCQGWQQPAGENKGKVASVMSNQNRAMSSGSSIQPMAQWVGQRPHKNSRTRRTSLVAPTPNNAEAQISCHSSATSDFSARTSSVGTNGSQLTSSLDNHTPKSKRELQNVSSPFGLSGSEESGARGNKLKDKGMDSIEISLAADQKVGAHLFPYKKNKSPTKEIGDSVRRQGRSGRGSSLTRPGSPPTMEKSENLPTTKSLQGLKPMSDKNKSKTGRPPSKKIKDRKVLTCVGPSTCNGSSDFTGESDDDHEELFLAANSARNASKFACSGPFWKKMELVFGSLSSEDISYLQQQLSFAEELGESLSQMFSDEYNISEVLMPRAVPKHSGEREGSHFSQDSLKTDALCEQLDMKRLEKVTPLYQRVLSALIEEGESEELYHQSEGKNIHLWCATDDSHCGSCNQNHIDVEPKVWDRMESEVESKVDVLTQKYCMLDRLSCDGSAKTCTLGNGNMSSFLHSQEQWHGDDDLSDSDVEQLQPRKLDTPSFPSSDCQYQLMCLDDRLLLELQSIGLCPERLPDLTEGEDVINQDIMGLEQELHQQIARKKKNLAKIDKTIQRERATERWRTELVAMDQLIEMAYRKRLASHGNYGSKNAVRKVSKQVALAFLKRTLSRCRKFEERGISCFSDPELQKVIFSEPSCNSAAKSIDCIGSGTASNTCNGGSHQAEVKRSGAASSVSGRYDSHSDNLESGDNLERDSSVALHAVIDSSGQASSKHGSVLNLNKGKKREVLITDIGGSASSMVTSALDDTHHEVQEKKNEREKGRHSDNLRNNLPSGAGRTSLDSSGSEFKTKGNSKQKNTQLPSQSVANASNTRSGVGPSLPSNTRTPSSKEADEPADFANLQLPELDSLEENQDLSTWLNFDEDGLQDHDSIGLEIPMDDLSELMLM
ncbi:uncharacterized protein LOC126615659 [Malus sylvestris]|uniref:uncharacterized protein LOC126615659 n=1 Tax=Malus sylvestris TaxID=3752 RepID=UPI0021ABFA05|nr:uncharacterized protein LOC126615659 [Malus sylvestris]